MQKTENFPQVVYNFCRDSVKDTEFMRIQNPQKPLVGAWAIFEGVLKIFDGEEWRRPEEFNKVRQKKFYIVINLDKHHRNQQDNRCETLEEAEKKASDLVTAYPHLQFVICQAVKIVRIKQPVEIEDLE